MINKIIKMKYIKKFEKFLSGDWNMISINKFSSEITKADRQLIQNRLEIGDWIEYYFDSFYSEIGIIIRKDNPVKEFDIIVQPIKKITILSLISF